MKPSHKFRYEVIFLSHFEIQEAYLNDVILWNENRSQCEILETLVSL